MTNRHPLPVRRGGFTLVELLVSITIIAVLVGLAVTALGVFSRSNDVRKTETTLELLKAAVDNFEDDLGRPLAWGSIRADDPNADVWAEDWHVYSVTELLRRIGRGEASRQALGRIAPASVALYDSTEPQPAWIASIDPADPQNPAVSGPLVRAAYTAGTYDGGSAILDAWGTPIRVVHAGPSYDRFSSNALLRQDRDGTVFMNADSVNGIRAADGLGPSPLGAFQGTEHVYGRVAGGSVFFVSAGPDRRFGSMNLGDGLDESDVDPNPPSPETDDNVYSTGVDLDEYRDLQS